MLEAAGILTPRSDRRDQSGANGEASRRVIGVATGYGGVSQYPSQCFPGCRRYASVITVVAAVRKAPGRLG